MEEQISLPVTQPLIIDLHLDLAWEALFWNRDLTLPVLEVRKQEDLEPPQVSDKLNYGGAASGSFSVR